MEQHNLILQDGVNPKINRAGDKKVYKEDGDNKEEEEINKEVGEDSRVDGEINKVGNSKLVNNLLGVIKMEGKVGVSKEGNKHGEEIREATLKAGVREVNKLGVITVVDDLKNISSFIE